VPPANPLMPAEEFRRGLRDLGYVEGKNVLIEYRYPEGKLDRLPELAAELVGLKVDVIVTTGTTGVRAAKKAAGAIPIVFISVNDPVATGLVASLARPGGNITGTSLFGPAVSGKRLEILTEAFPKLTRVAFLWTPTLPGTGLKGMQEAAPVLGLKLQAVAVRDSEDFNGAFAAVLSERAQALALPDAPIFVGHRKRIIEFAANNRLPAFYPSGGWVDAGGLMSYGVNSAELQRSAAVYVDKILKGAKPADLPVGQPTKFELVINLKTARHIGVTIPPRVLAWADEVIK